MAAYTQKDFALMQRALELAQQAIGTTAPNPSVGCVIVKNGHIIGQGATRKGGRPHAEVIALQQAGEQANGATAYVTLEPCSHYGQTPPCAKALIEAKIAKAYIATIDISAKVNGAGIRLLKEAGIEVFLGLCQNEAIKLNQGFFSVIEKSRPYITIKLATTIDGKIATSTGDSKWISNNKARDFVHGLRAKNDAIMVGIGTVLADDPLLNCRLKGYEDRNPCRIIIDSNLRIPRDSQILRTAKEIPTIIYTRVQQEIDNIQVVRAPIINDKIDLNFVLKDIAGRGITRLLVEGGSSIATSMLENDVFDELIWIRSPMLIGNDGIPAIANLGVKDLSSAKRLKLIDISTLDNNIIEKYQAI